LKQLATRENQTPRFDRELANKVRDRYEASMLHISSAYKTPTVNKEPHFFYQVFAQNLRYVEVDYGGGFTGAVRWAKNAVSGELLIDVRNCQNLKLRQFAGLVVHEILHVAHEHVHMETAFRRQYPKLFNIAADIVVEEEIKKQGYQWIEGPGYFPDDPTLDATGINLDTVEKMFGKRPPANESIEVYCQWMLDNLPKQDPPQGGGGGPRCKCPDCKGSGKQQSQPGQDPGEPGQEPGDDGGEPGDQEPCPSCGGKGQMTGEEIIDWLYDRTGHENGLLDDNSDMTEAQREQMKMFVAEALNDAVEASGGIGQLPGSLQTSVKNVLKLLEPKVTLEYFLNEVVGGSGFGNPYVRRNRLNRRGHIGVLGFMNGAAVGTVIDTSGSVNNREIQMAFGMTKQIADDHNFKTFLVQCSYGETHDEILDVEEVLSDGNGERIGYGGTNMRPGVMRYVTENEEKGECQTGTILVISDGELGMDSLVTPEEVDVPVYWLFSRKVRNPFGSKPFAGEMWYFDADSGYVERIA
jgi:predicted metal-dependent peptidase